MGIMTPQEFATNVRNLYQTVASGSPDKFGVESSKLTSIQAQINELQHIGDELRINNNTPYVALGNEYLNKFYQNRVVYHFPDIETTPNAENIEQALNYLDSIIVHDNTRARACYNSLRTVITRYDAIPANDPSYPTVQKWRIRLTLAYGHIRANSFARRTIKKCGQCAKGVAIAGVIAAVTLATAYYFNPTATTGAIIKGIEYTTPVLQSIANSAPAQTAYSWGSTAHQSASNGVQYLGSSLKHAWDSLPTAQAAYSWGSTAHQSASNGVQHLGSSLKHAWDSLPTAQAAYSWGSSTLQGGYSLLKTGVNSGLSATGDVWNYMANTRLFQTLQTSSASNLMCSAKDAFTTSNLTTDLICLATDSPNLVATATSLATTAASSATTTGTTLLTASAIAAAAQAATSNASSTIPFCSLTSNQENAFNPTTPNPYFNGSTNLFSNALPLEPWMEETLSSSSLPITQPSLPTTPAIATSTDNSRALTLPAPPSQAVNTPTLTPLPRPFIKSSGVMVTAPANDASVALTAPVTQPILPTTPTITTSADSSLALTLPAPQTLTVNTPTPLPPLPRPFIRSPGALVTGPANNAAVALTAPVTQPSLSTTPAIATSTDHSRALTLPAPQIQAVNTPTPLPRPFIRSTGVLVTGSANDAAVALTAPITQPSLPTTPAIATSTDHSRALTLPAPQTLTVNTPTPLPRPFIRSPRALVTGPANDAAIALTTSVTQPSLPTTPAIATSTDHSRALTLPAPQIQAVSTPTPLPRPFIRSTGVLVTGSANDAAVALTAPVTQPSLPTTPAIATSTDHSRALTLPAPQTLTVNTPTPLPPLPRPFIRSPGVLVTGRQVSPEEINSISQIAQGSFNTEQLLPQTSQRSMTQIAADAFTQVRNFVMAGIGIFSLKKLCTKSRPKRSETVIQPSEDYKSELLRRRKARQQMRLANRKAYFSQSNPVPSQSPLAAALQPQPSASPETVRQSESPNPAAAFPGRPPSVIDTADIGVNSRTSMSSPSIAPPSGQQLPLSSINEKLEPLPRPAQTPVQSITPEAPSNFINPNVASVVGAQHRSSSSASVAPSQNAQFPSTQSVSGQRASGTLALPVPKSPRRAIPSLGSPVDTENDSLVPTNLFSQFT